MASFPQPGSVTICEINRLLITAGSISDDRAKETYGKLLGMVFSPVPFQSDPGPQQDAEQQGSGNDENVQVTGLVGKLQGLISDSLKRVFHPNDVNLLPEVDLHGVSWHQHKHIVAFISGPNQVIVRDYEDSEGKEPCILICESQRDIKALQWRPNGGKSLSVAWVGFAFGLLLIRVIYHLLERVLLQPALEVLGLDGLWWIFFEVITMSK